VKKYIAKVQYSPERTRVMTGVVHRLHGDFYLVAEGDIAEWYPILSDFYEHVGYDVYGKDVFLRDVVGFVAPDGKRKVGIVFEDEEWGASIREVTMIAEMMDSENPGNYTVSMKHDGEDYYLTPNGIRRLCSSLEPRFHEIEEFLSGRSIETDRMEATRKIEYEESQG